MDKLPGRVLAEKENVETALSNLKDAMAGKKKSVIELAAAVYGKSLDTNCELCL